MSILAARAGTNFHGSRLGESRGSGVTIHCLTHPRPRKAVEPLAMAEEEGRRRGCTRIALTTLSVEAPGFYQKQGYDIAATIDCDPPGLTRYYMMKRLVPVRG